MTKKLISLAFGVMMSVAANAADLPERAGNRAYAEGVATYVHLDNDFTGLFLKGDPAEEIYKRMSIPQKEEGTPGAFSKASEDKRINCVFNPNSATQYHCQIYINSSSGSVYQSWRE